MVMLAKKRGSRGFSLIEVVLVLAIAGLLLIVVFLAVSGAQMSRRDFQRKQDLAQLLADVQKYSANNAARIPQNQGQLDGVFSSYYNRKDPSTGNPYTGEFNVDSAPHD